MPRIVLFGATGYTGRLTAEALVARGGRPLLAGRSAERLEALAADLGGSSRPPSPTSRDPASVRALLEPGDVIVATVGPFVRYGDAAVEAAIAAGALYLDSTGEPAFIRRVFERYGAEAERAGASLVTAFGYDWVPGNLAGALALRDAGDAATRVDVGYFTTGGLGGMSGGTRASAAGAMLEPSFVWRSGIRTERGAVRMRSFEVAGKIAPGDLGRLLRALRPAALHPGLREVNVYLGWFGSSSAGDAGHVGRQRRAQRIPGLKSGIDHLIDRFVPTSTGGPTPPRASRPARRSSRSPTARQTGARQGRGAGRQRLHVHRRGARLGSGRGAGRDRGGRRARTGGGVRARPARGRLRRGRDHPGRLTPARCGRSRTLSRSSVSSPVLYSARIRRSVVAPSMRSRSRLVAGVGLPVMSVNWLGRNRTR